MGRLDVYTAVHKMQRARLFRLTIEAGRTGPDDLVARAGLAAAVEALSAELITHAQHEERFIHPFLRRRDPELSATLGAAHEELHTDLGTLCRVASADARSPGDPNSLYRALATFTATYLDHVGFEEARALPVLWEGFSDEELMGILVPFREARSPAENLTSLLAELATLNPTEMAEMVTTGLGGVALSDLTEILATLSSPQQLGRLHALLAQAGS